MQLLTKEIRRKALRNHGREIDSKNPNFVAHFFNPLGNQHWYLFSIDPKEEWRAYGLAFVHELEWGTFSIDELSSVQVGLGLGIERDIHWDDVNTFQEIEKRVFGKW